jgi:hypothetical protein
MDNINIQLNSSGRQTNVSGYAESENGRDSNMKQNKADAFNSATSQQNPSLEESKEGGPLKVNPPSEKSWFTKLCPCFSIEFFQSYFDVNT